MLFLVRVLRSEGRHITKIEISVEMFSTSGLDVNNFHNGFRFRGSMLNWSGGG